MTPTKEQLADKHCGFCSCGSLREPVIYEFTLDQLDAYFLERLKVEAGELVGYIDSNGSMMCNTTHPHWHTPLYALEILK